MTSTDYDVAIIGGGHNGLVAASYLSRSGLRVVLLERSLTVGGAAISEEIFPGVDARISTYSYLVSLFPQKIVSDLGLRFKTKRRSVASYTPYNEDDRRKSLLMSNDSPHISSESLHRLDRFGREARRYQRLLELEALFAQRIWPTLLLPLQSEDKMERHFQDQDGKEAWNYFVKNPLGEYLDTALSHDALRGLVFTDAKIGVFTHPYDPSFLQNRTFIYHIIGNGTGEWRVPVGGMGAVTGTLARCAEESGAELKTGCRVIAVESPGAYLQIKYEDKGSAVTISSRFVLINAAPQVVSSLFSRPLGHKEVNEGSVFKINMLLTRLPRLKDSQYSERDAFTGTFHLDEGYEAMKKSYREALEGAIPLHVPGEMYCHSLTDDSVLSEDLKERGYQTLTLFGLDMPYHLFTKDNKKTKEEVTKRYLAAINKYLAEPIEDCLAVDGIGRPCIDAKSPVDLEHELCMPLGNIFHGPFSWPFAEMDEEQDTWGVETEYDNVFICGSGARRGGAVSGIPGHNAAMKVLEKVSRSH